MGTVQTAFPYWTPVVFSSKSLTEMPPIKRVWVQFAESLDLLLYLDKHLYSLDLRKKNWTLSHEEISVPIRLTLLKVVAVAAILYCVVAVHPATALLIPAALAIKAGYKRYLGRQPQFQESLRDFKVRQLDSSNVVQNLIEAVQTQDLPFKISCISYILNLSPGDKLEQKALNAMKSGSVKTEVQQILSTLEKLPPCIKIQANETHLTLFIISTIPEQEIYRIKNALKYLSITHLECMIAIPEKQMDMLFKILKDNDTVVADLDLSRCEIDDDGAHRLCNILDNLSTLRVLRLQHNKMQSGYENLCYHLGNSNISHLYLDKSNLSDVSVFNLTQMLRENKSKIEVLSLRECQISTVPQFFGIGEVIEKNRLKALLLGKNKGRDYEIGLLVKKLEGNSSIETLDLSENAMEDDTGVKLGEVLQKDTSAIVHLNLAGNKLGDKTAKALRLVLEKNQKLKSLNLKNNQIGDEGIAELIEGMKSDKTKKTVFLNGNAFTQESLNALESFKRQYPEYLVRWR